MSFIIQKLSVGEVEEFNGLVEVFEKVFETKATPVPGNLHLRKLLDNAQFAAFIAKDGNMIVGGATVYVLQQYMSARSYLYIFDLAVLEDHQRKGIGTRLIDHIKTFGKAMGAEALFVQADEADRHALDFYHRTGGRAEQVIHYTYPLE